MKVALSGYFIGVVIGVPLGIAMAWFKPVDYFVTPLFDLLRPVPGIAWLPVMIVLFGIGLLSKAMVIFLSAFIACVINSYSGIKNTKPVHLWVGQTFGIAPRFVQVRLQRRHEFFRTVPVIFLRYGGRHRFCRFFRSRCFRGFRSGFPFFRRRSGRIPDHRFQHCHHVRQM
ncbi:MAG: hypothetical protein IKV72_03735 [Firmicutes bacterium]|nr:hypothetical protein [Bacillota bacterium]